MGPRQALGCKAGEGAGPEVPGAGSETERLQAPGSSSLLMGFTTFETSSFVQLPRPQPTTATEPDRSFVFFQSKSRSRQAGLVEPHEEVLGSQASLSIRLCRPKHTVCPQSHQMATPGRTRLLHSGRKQRGDRAVAVSGTPHFPRHPGTLPRATHWSDWIPSRPQHGGKLRNVAAWNKSQVVRREVQAGQERSGLLTGRNGLMLLATFATAGSQ